MSQEVIDDIEMKIDGKINLDARSIGVSNMINRLRLYYQNKAEIILKSKICIGTEFILVIPKIHYKNYDEN